MPSMKWKVLMQFDREDNNQTRFDRRLPSHKKPIVKNENT